MIRRLSFFTRCALALPLLVLAAPVIADAQAPPSPTGRTLRFAVFGTAGLFTATAKDTFDAILDTRSGTDVGVGAQVAWQSGTLRGLFVEFDASRFEETGERVFVHEGEVFPLRHPADHRPDAHRGLGGLSTQPGAADAHRRGRLPLAFSAAAASARSATPRRTTTARSANASRPGTSWAGPT